MIWIKIVKTMFLTPAKQEKGWGNNELDNYCQ